MEGDIKGTGREIIFQLVIRDICTRIKLEAASTSGQVGFKVVTSAAGFVKGGVRPRQLFILIDGEAAGGAHQ